jgi:hypothetical protein
MAERRFLLVEITGPWTRDAVAGSWPERSRLAADVSAALAEAAAQAGVRLLAIRRSGADAAGRQRPAGDDGRRVWGFADTAAADRGLVWGTWTDGARLLDLDLAADLAGLIAGAERAGLAPVAAARPAALVCTHGGRDACCAVLGRPLLAVLADRDDVDVWECSHVGGHRFSGNLLALPTGLLYGRVGPDTAGPVADAEVAGRMALDLLRGRCGVPEVEQAAEVLARQAWGEDRQDAVRVTGAADDDDGGWRVQLERRTAAGWTGHLAELKVALGRSGPASCGKPKTEVTRRYELVALTST